MNIVADILGWRKVIDVPQEAIDSGVVTINISYPITNLVKLARTSVPNNKILEIGEISVRLHSVGNNVFKFIP